MVYYILKIAITVVLIIAISEIAKKSSMFGAVLASIPIISVLAMFWLYFDTQNVEKVSALSTSIFWLVIPSLALFIILPILLKNGFNFYLCMAISCGITALCYYLMVSILGHFGVKL